MFLTFQSAIKNNPFNELLKTPFESITKGRLGAVLVEPYDGRIPIVRTTTIYKNAAIRFNDLHREIVSDLELKFNNAMIELYGSAYKTMGFHSDQALDLEKNSSIAVYSCYADPTNANRSLIIMDKITKETSEIRLEHNSIVVFSVETNSKYMHKIVLDINASSNEWIGITYRYSKTYIKPGDLYLANESERREFYKQKNIENNSQYTYELIPYTISPSDLLPVD